MGALFTSLGTEVMGILSLFNPLISVLFGVIIMHKNLRNFHLTVIALIFDALLMLSPKVQKWIACYLKQTNSEFSRATN
jgi:threonine/homoserine efflux transporter RhtA